MKALYTNLLAVCAISLSQPAWAQWPSSPSSPTRVADSAQANYPFLLADPDQGGFFAFWSDGRVANGNEHAIYGQRVSGTGQKLWGSKGRRIIWPRIRVWDYSAIRTSGGKMLIAFTQGSSGDSLRVISVDTSGAILWNKLVAGRGMSASSIYVGDPQLKEVEGRVYIAYYVTYTGGSGKIQWNVIDPANGNLLIATGNGVPNPATSGGPFTLQPGPAGAMWLIWRNSNGSGTPLSARKFHADSGRFLASAGTSLTTGQPGLNYGFTTASDSAGGFYGVIRANSAPARLDAFHIGVSGQHLFTPSFRAIHDGTTGTGDNQVMRRANGRNYVAWSDNRPPAANADIFIQAFDDDGNAIWGDTNGVRTHRMGSYIPYALLVEGDSGAMYTVATMGPGTYVQSIQPDGSLPWGEGLKLVEPNANIRPFYNNWNYYRMADKSYVLVYITGTDGALYMTRWLPDGTLTGTRPTASQQVLRVWPNPVAGSLRYSLPAGALSTSIQILDGQGRLIRSDTATGSVDLRALPPGLYTLQAGAQRARFAKQ